MTEGLLKPRNVLIEEQGHITMKHATNNKQCPLLDERE